MEFDQAFTDEFIAEAKEHTETIEECCLGLESYEGESVPKIIDKLFRSIHSIKGAAGFLGFEKIKELSHIMETMLQMMRSGELKPESHFIDALLAGNDRLNIMLDDVMNSNEVDIKQAHDTIAQLIGQSVSGETQQEMTSSIPIPEEQPDTVLFEVNSFKLKNLPPSHEFLYQLRFDLNKLMQADGISPVHLVKNLLGTGIILDSKVETSATDLTQSLEKSSFHYYVLYSTMMNIELVSFASKLEDDDIIQISLEDLRDTAETLKREPEEPSKEAAPAEETPQKAEEKTEAKEAGGAPDKKEKSTPPKEHEATETIRINVGILNKLMNMAGELVLVRNQQLMTADYSDPVARGISQRLDMVTTELQETIMRTRMQPIGNIFGKLPRIIRDLTRKLGKKIDLQLFGNEVELDKTILESLTDPLTHIIRNSCDHGIEVPEDRLKAGKEATGTIKVRAFHEAGQINLEIIDDGKGLDIEAIKAKAIKNSVKTEAELAQMSEKEILSLIMLAGFSTAKNITDVSGRGVGMDVVANGIEQLGGTIDLESTLGKGTSIHLRLPLTLAIIPCLVIVSNGFRYAIPQVNLEELVCLYDDDVYTKIEYAGNQEVFRLRNELLPMVRLEEILKSPTALDEHSKSQITKHFHQIALEQAGKEIRQSLNFAVLKSGSRRFGLIVDQVIGTEEIVVKPMHSTVKNLRVYSGSTIMGDGEVAMIMDIEGIANHAGLQFDVYDDQAAVADHHGTELPSQDVESQKVLLFHCGSQEQFAISLPLIKRIEKVTASSIEKIGDKEFINIDGQSTLVLKLENHLNVSHCEKGDNMFLLIPKFLHHSVGILISDIVDSCDASLKLDVSSYLESGVLGTAIVQDKMTIFIDVFHLVEKAAPEWFEDRKSKLDDNDKVKVLLLEDAVFFQQLMKGYLEADNYTVTTASNGKEGLALLESQSFDLIVSDIEMPVMDGMEFITHVRTQDSYKHIPAIALTALDSEEDRQRCLESGFDAHEVKLNREILLHQISKLLKEKSSETV